MKKRCLVLDKPLRVSEDEINNNLKILKTKTNQDVRVGKAI